MFLDAFLTEYDDSLGSELNVDPLGMQVIWSAFGQRIFRNRVSSISNDVRNYTLNLFNHWLIRQVIHDDAIVLSKALQKVYPSKQDLNFKYACLVLLENLYVYSMIAHQNHKGVNTIGVLGISKARSNWESTNHDPVLQFSHDPKAYVLVRQTLLGVSGRYKTPLVEMGFFDRHYQYDQPDFLPHWQKVDQLVAGVPQLKKLSESLLAMFRSLLAEYDKHPTIAFADLPQALKRAMVDAFPSQAAVGTYACDFWLGITQLNEGAAGALYQALKATAAGHSLDTVPTADIFASALNQTLSHDDKDKLDHVRLLEPFLGELDLLFTLMLGHQQRSLQDIEDRWVALGRSINTLSVLAKPIESNPTLFRPLSVTGKARLSQLLDLAKAPDVQSQIQKLLIYHGDVMQSRGQLPWLKLVDNDSLKLNVRPRREPALKDRAVGQWVNHYYLPQFRNLLNGLWGLAA